MELIKGDLVQPLMSCAGQPGFTRCLVSIVIDVREDKNEQHCKIACPCGTTEWMPSYTMEKLIEKK